MVLAANSPRSKTSVVRLSLIWGVVDHTLPTIVELVRKGQFGWIDRDDYPFVTTHVGNLCHGAILAAEVGRGGQAYFLTDGDVIRLQDLVAALLRTQGLDPPGRSYFYGVAWGIAGLMEFSWRVLRRPGSPPLTRTMIPLSSRGFVACDVKARAELGYVPVVSRTEGLSQLKGEAMALRHGETANEPGHVHLTPPLA